jgi:hypothetical protein
MLFGCKNVPASPRRDRIRRGDFCNLRKQSRKVLPRGQILGKSVRMTEFDPDQLERLMMAAF